MKTKKNLHQKTKIILAICINLSLILPATATFVDTTNNGEITTTTNYYTPGFGTDTIYVDDNNTEGPWNGSMNFPYQFIQDGIDNAGTCDTVFVFEGEYFENIVIYKSITLQGENKDTTIINSQGYGTVVMLTVSYIDISDFTIKNSGENLNNAGIIVHTSYNDILRNNIVDTNIGIQIYGQNNFIRYNNFIQNTLNAHTEKPNSICKNYWDDHISEDNNEDGFADEPYNISGNTTQDNYPLIHIYGSIQNLDTNEIFITIQAAINDENTETGHTIFVKSDIYHEHLHIEKSIKLLGENPKTTILDGRNQNNIIEIYNDNVQINSFTIKNSGNDSNQLAGIYIQSNQNYVHNCIIEHNFQGIMLNSHSEHNKISKNKIRNNGWNGIYICSSCTGNIITTNTIETNIYAGIAISDASYNTIHHNNLINNNINAYDNSNNIWDSGYPSGGNYWSDYNGDDAYNGPNQDQTGSDGIGDTPYPIQDGINSDHYPLIDPYQEGDTILPYVKITSPQNGLYIRNKQRLSNFLQSTIIFGQITIEVDAFDAHSGISQVVFYIDNHLYIQHIDDTPPYTWTWLRTPLLKIHKHTIKALAIDNAGNENFDTLFVRKYF